MKIQVNRVGPDRAKLPERKHYNDAGADLYLPAKAVLPKDKTVSVGLGISVEIPDGYFGLVYPRSSWAAKGVQIALPPIDSGYRGEIHAVIINLSGETIIADAGERIGQLVIQPVVLAEYVQDLGDARGTGAFGSTGK